MSESHGLLCAPAEALATAAAGGLVHIEQNAALGASRKADQIIRTTTTVNRYHRQWFLHGHFSLGRLRHQQIIGHGVEALAYLLQGKN